MLGLRKADEERVWTLSSSREPHFLLLARLSSPFVGLSSFSRLIISSPDTLAVVWKNHKRVCGKPGFALPLLNKEESSYLLDRMKTVVPTLDDCPDSTL